MSDRPYGDVMTSDEGLTQMMRDRKERFSLAKKVREVKTKRMSKTAFARWKAKAVEIGDDEPLSKFV